jgi:hypothetical protein
VVWLVRVRRAAWFLRVLQEMLVLRDIPEVPGRLMGDGRAVCPDPEPGRGGGALVSWADRTARWDRRPAGRGMVRFVFYGRVSTEDWQDPVTSRAR